MSAWTAGLARVRRPARRAALAAACVVVATAALSPFFLLWFELVVAPVRARLAGLGALRGVRRYCVPAAFLYGAVVTTTPDPFNQALVAMPVGVVWVLGLTAALSGADER